MAPTTRRSGRAFAALVTLTAILAGACVAPAASPSPAAPSATNSSVAASPSAPAATPTAAPTPSADPFATVPTAPSGTWRSVTWTALPNALPAALRPGERGSFQVFGWSRGYVGFTITPVVPTDEQINSGDIPGPIVTASSSTDGIHWRAGQVLDPRAAGSGGGLMTFRAILEGPSGLLALGWSGGCASENLDSLWTSTDGVAWSPVDAAKAFGAPGVIAHVSGGGAGFVAVAYRGEGAWTSADGRSWHRVGLDATPFANALVDDGTAVAGTFVLGGTTGTRDCGASVMTDPTPKPVARTPAAWWSADGATWTKATLPRAVASTNPQSVWTAHLGDRAAILVDDVAGTKRFAWGSDGRVWKAIDLPADIGERNIVNVGDHSLIVTPPAGPGSTPGSLMALRTIGDGFTVVSLASHGDAPSLVYQLPWGGPTYGLVAVGPTGVIVTSADGSELWFGQASAQ